ncbi:peptidase S8 [Deinococcus indicus]|uniref:Peptidase S8 n=1 Tax=Deinococcus indicus TaxID=223556 RepID=A0A246BQU1_9DEIO|nr:S8 family serine peptidase [Deinococcus indicus]OWL98039.1 peptidase S8 [Deinococcus indicus]
MKKVSTIGLGLTVLLAACGQSTPQSSLQAAAPQGLTAQGAATLSACSALYAQEPSGVQIDGSMRYGQVGTLLLTFLDDTSKGRAITWMDSHLDVDLGDGLGAFENLPIVAVRTLITPAVVDTLQANLPGLASIYQDAPLQYKLAESVKFIGADTAQSSYGVSGKGIGVGIIDSGVDATHPDLAHTAKNVKLVGPITDTPAGGYLFVDLPNTDTSSGHGTHVASTIGGSGEASAGSRMRRGVAPGATLVGVGAGDGLSILYALQGFDYLMKPEIRETYNVRVISNSWGSSGEFAPYNPISIASKRAYEAGMVVVFAAGNEGPDANTLNPYSASPCVISVAAGDKKGYLADFSSRGRPGDTLVHPDITAPGVKISAARALTGLAATTVPDADNPRYSSISGTSMATPHISGVVALMLEANPKLNLDGVMKIFSKTSRNMYYVATATNGFDPAQVVVKQREEWEVGYGYVNADAAVREAAKLNPNRFTVQTTALPGWTGTVQTAVCAPTVNCVQNAQDSYTLNVPSGASVLRVSTEWGNPAFDLDLEVYNPAGQLVGSSAQGASTGEAVSIPRPVAGNWRVVLKGYLNAPTTYTGKAAVDRIVKQ